MDKQEMIRNIQEKVLLPLEGYNMGDFRQVFIGDVLQWQYETAGVKSCPKERSILVEMRLNFRKPIDDQPVECIEYIYNLLG